jgi:hypothetical protein
MKQTIIALAACLLLLAACKKEEPPQPQLNTYTVKCFSNSGVLFNLAIKGQITIFGFGAPTYTYQSTYPHFTSVAWDSIPKNKTAEIICMENNDTLVHQTFTATGTFNYKNYSRSYFNENINR